MSWGGMERGGRVCMWRVCENLNFKFPHMSDFTMDLFVVFLAFLIKYSSEFFDLDAIIDDDDMDMFLLLAVLLFLKSSSSSAREYYRGPGQDYMAWSNWRFREAFRFEKVDFDRLVQLLQIPDRFAESGHVFSGPVCFAVTLYRFSYPCRWCSLEGMFGEDRSRLSRMHKLCVDFLYARWGFKVDMDLGFLLPRLVSYRRAIFAKTGGLVGNMWGFIDGTARQICRPTFFQRLFFSGHKRNHCLKYQGIMCPDGIIAQMKGPWVGRRNDCGMLNESQLVDILRAHFNDREIPLVLYGDTIYTFTTHIWSGFKGARLSDE